MGNYQAEIIRLRTEPHYHRIDISVIDIGTTIA